MHDVVTWLAAPTTQAQGTVLAALQGGWGLVILPLVVASCLAVAWRLLRRVGEDPSPAEEPAAAPQPSAHGAAAAREQERELLSYDLHDGLAQYVLAAQMHLDTFTGLRDADPERAEYELAAARQRLREATAEVYRIIANLSLAASAGVCLSEAVERHLARIADYHPWHAELDSRIGRRRFDPSVESMVFRVVQEALNNAARHSGSSRVRVSLHTEGANLVATVRDWGCGFDPDTVQWNSRRLGLRGMCGRARLLGGSCEIDSRPGKAARVTIRVPCPNPGSD